MADGTVAIVHSADDLLESIGLVPSEAQKNADPDDMASGSYAPENYSKIDGDIIFLNPRGTDKESFMEDSAFGIIKDRVVWDDSGWGSAMNLGGIIAKTWAPSALVDSLSDLKVDTLAADH